ncbi:hypothetical protein LCGC14_2194720, partial [marine sediment metagenome]
AVCGLLVSAATAAGVRIPITVTEPNGVGSRRGHVSTGVPLLVGQMADAKDLRLLDDRGKEVVAQFRPLARWWNKDNSLRWVLVDFTARLGGHQSRQYVLTDGGKAKYESPLKVTRTDARIVVDTGSAEFVINRKRFNLFDRVRIDMNGDGQYEADEECVSPGSSAGGVVMDTYGLAYLGSEGTEQVVVEEAGPVRVWVMRYVPEAMNREP